MRDCYGEVHTLRREGKVVIVGFGLMGRQIGQLFAQKGFEVIGVDRTDEILGTALNEIMEGRFGLKRAVKRGKLTEEEAKESFERISTTTNLKGACGKASFVIESVYEDLALKKDVFKKIDSYCRGDVILATNTSTLSITEIATATNRPDKVIGMHFFNPPQVMRLVEVIRGLLTSNETINFTKDLARKLGKHPIVVKDYPGFATSRLGIKLFLEACEMLQEGVANIQDIDTCMRLGYGHPMGPFELADLIGLDTRLKIIEALRAQTGDPAWKTPVILKQLVASGYIGDPKLKPGSKGGFYEYYNLKKPGEVMGK